MTKKISIAIDAMGGENAPTKNIKGLSIFLDKNKHKSDYFFYLYGNKETLLKELKKNNINDTYVEIIHTDSIVSDEETREGTYFVRFSMNFDYNGTSRIMQSRGHWNMEQWEAATSNVTDNYPGNINLDTLGVDGIIPDSSFGVKKPIPKWPL